jgi:hypothetical protein
MHQGVSEPEFGLPKDLIYGKDHRDNYRERGFLYITIGITEDAWKNSGCFWTTVKHLSLIIF